jgi:hypothetical protein
MPESLSAPEAKWIWLDKPQREKNSYACFRRVIALDEPPRDAATVRVTADARYELWVNGTFVGHGPVRAWPSHWPVDEYDVRHLLTRGRNVIGVLVTHYGVSTFQYIHDEPGLLAQIDVAGQRAVSDSTWKSTPHDGYLWPVPRITCQQAWEEQFDARIAPGLPQEWSVPSFDDGAWKPSRELRPAGQPPHANLERRDIPFLTLEPVEPARVQAIDVVRPADYHFALNPREFISASDKSMNHIVARMLLATFVHSDREQPVDFHLPHTRPNVPWKLNGQELKFDDYSLHKTDTGVAHATLKKGVNVLIARLPESEHHFWANLNVRTQHPVSFSTSPDRSDSGDSGWLAVGPFAGEPKRHSMDTIVIRAERIEPAATGDRYAQLWQSGALTAKDLSEPFVRPMRPDMVATRDAYATCVSDRVETTVAAHVDEPAAIQDRGSASWATIHPAHDGAGVRLLLDFGREIIGFHEIELDAPAGAVVDVHNFEFIQRDGRFNLNESMNNSFRYVCREGVQRYKTFLRRGLKYSWVTFRNFSRPIRLRGVRVLNSTYPQTGDGSFECSDAKLTKIWEVGVRSVRCCSEDTYTDCPTYEQTLWVGDARNEALVDLVANGDRRLSERCLRLTGRSLDRSTIAESQVPSGWQNLLPTWTFLWMRWAQEHFQLTGDRGFGKEMLGYLDRNFAGMKAAINDDRGLFNLFAWNLFDWAPMDTPADGIVTHINCLAALALKQSAQLARDLGEESRASEWESAARGLTDAVNRHLWSDSKGAYVDCIRADGTVSPVFSQQTQTAAYISGVATGDRAKRCGQIMHHPPDGFVKAGSPFFMFFLLEALVMEHRHAEMIDTIRDYWGKQIDAGATTFWEMYREVPNADAALVDSKSRHRLTRSHCHGWSAAPTFFLTQHVLGIQPAEPGYAAVRIAPRLGALTWAQGRVPTPRGVVACYWRRDGNAFELTTDAPAGVPLRVELPVKGEVTVLEGKADVAEQVVTAAGPRLKLSVRG